MARRICRLRRLVRQLNSQTESSIRFYIPNCDRTRICGGHPDPKPSESLGLCWPPDGVISAGVGIEASTSKTPVAEISLGALGGIRTHNLLIRSQML